MINTKLLKKRGYKIFIVVNADWFFMSHRLPIALEAKKNGFHVTIVAKDTGSKNVITKHGFDFIELPINRSSVNIFKEIRTILFLIKIYKQFQPDLVHHVTIKPVIYGSTAARLTKTRYVVNAISGLGHVFISNTISAIILRKFVSVLYQLSFYGINQKIIFQNKFDKKIFLKSSIIKNYQTKLIRGSGVDINEFKFFPEKENQMVILFASRLLWTKGIDIFIQAAKKIKKEKTSAKFIIIGRFDHDNPARVLEKDIINWQNDDLIEYWGDVTNVADILATSNIVCLPTYYGEGVPKILIEAASCGRAIITTDVPGCNDIVKQNINGLLIPPRNVDALVDSIRLLINNNQLRKSMGRKGRDRVKEHFNIDLIVQQHLEVYNSFLNIK